jgi:tetratricopeptide (TPR) repeat protein
MPLLRSRLLARLDAAIAAARHPVQIACLRAERACFLARQGHIAQARQAIDQIRLQFALHPHASVSAWLHLAEGLQDHFSSLSPNARDKVQRAHGLSAAAGLRPLQALCAAWLAQMEFGRGNDEAIARNVAEAVKLAAADDHSVHSRIGLVLAHCYHGAGRADRAQPWYAKAREHAVADGDEAALSALMHNQGWMRCADARVAELFGSGGRDQARQALIAAESTAHFDAGIGTASLASLVPMMRAQLLVLDGRCADALTLFDEQFDAALRDGLERMSASLLADMAWCCISLGQVERARRLAEDALLQVDAQENDDRALTLAQLARVQQSLGDPSLAKALLQRAAQAREAFRIESERLIALLDAALATAT